MALSVEHVKKILSENRSKSLYEIYVPSLEKTFSFKPITVGQQLSLSKFSIEEDKKDVNFYNVLCSLIEELSDNKVLMKDINEIDRLYILGKIDSMNAIDPKIYNITCPYCQKQFKHELALDKYLENYSKNKIQKKAITCKGESLNIDLVLGMPSVETVIKFKELETKPHPLYIHIIDIKFNGESIENFSSLDVKSRIDIINNLPIKRNINEDFQQFFEKIFEEYLIYTFKCEHCQAELKDTINIDSFFLK
jgi:hypothetical protein